MYFWVKWLISLCSLHNYDTMRCGWLEGVLSLDGTLDRKQVIKQKSFFAIHMATWCCIVFISILGTDPVPVTIGSRVLIIGGSAFSIVVVLCKRQVTSQMVAATAILYGIAIMFSDLSGRTYGGHGWAPFVLVVDYLLVMGVNERCALGVVCAVVVWLIVVESEEAFRYGLLDMPGLYPQDGEFGRREVFRKNMDCTDVPCPTGQMTSVLFIIPVFVIDFVATRGFTREILKEQATMERTINIVQEIASLLAGYDVERVAELLAEHEGHLPEEMTSALRSLEENLRVYRPYLPAALFEEVGGVQYTSVAPPGLDSETATIVFTDIRASTSIWESAPDGMRAALKIHNAVMREVMQMCGGYEVKTIGDAFMIAFASTCDGVAFGLRVQERLFEADWPASLLEDAPICSRQGSLWGGLTVRIGVNTGPVTVEQNTLTGRTDYFGHTVNVASRLESTCTPGAVAVPSQLWVAECGSCSAVVGAPTAVELKGVSGTTSVCCVWPVSLGGREDVPLCESSAPNERPQNTWMDTPLSELRQSSMKSRDSSTDASSTDSVLLPRSTVQSGQQVCGTVGVAELAVGDVGGDTVLHSVSSGLATLTIALEQSGGSLVTLLGNCVCVGWNVSRSAPAHVENAIRFAQRMLAKSALNGVGLASGCVQHGAVGARRQRFVTVMGQIVRRSWTLCEEAVREGPMCLYESPQDTTLPSALEDVLLPFKGCYRAVDTSDSRDTVL